MAQKSNLTIEVLSIIGGILTAIFFLGFLALASILRSEISCLITGSILIITTLIINRRLTKPFLDAMNITCYIAGCILAGFGMSSNIDVLFIVLIGISIVTMLLSKGFILTFLSVVSFYTALFGEITNLLSPPNPLNVAIVPIMAVFLFVNLLETKILSHTNGDLSKYKPIHSGLFVSCVLALGGLSINYLTQSSNDWIISVFMLAGILITVYKIMQVMQVKSLIHQVCIYLLCILICLPSLHAPYLSGSILLILICFHYGYKAECAAALLLFIYAISKYYYDLEKRQDMKKYSSILIIANLVLLLVYFNWSVYQKEQTLKEGQLVLLQLAPVDPRSLMQGDYMRLSYKEANSELTDGQEAKRGYVVLKLDHNHVGKIMRLQESPEPVNENEIVLKYKTINGRLFLGAESFFFEEGQDSVYNDAAYGGLRVDSKGESLLVGLYDEDFRQIKPYRSK